MRTCRDCTARHTRERSNGNVHHYCNVNQFKRNYEKAVVRIDLDNKACKQIKLKKD